MNSAQLKFFVGAGLLAALTFVGCATPESSMVSLDPNATQVEGDTPNDMTFKLTEKDHPGLLDPSKAKFTAPDVFKAKFKTTKGDFIVEVNRDWAPNGADRFYSMVKIGYFKNTGIFRAIEGFMFQFGVHGVPEVAGKWTKANIKDDPKGKSNIPGTLSFAQTGQPNSRSSQMFVNLGNNTFLDNPRRGSPFVPFGRIVEGMNVAGKINTSYGENSPEVQGKFTNEGNAFIQKKYPALDYILSVSLVDDKEKEAAEKATEGGNAEMSTGGDKGSGSKGSGDKGSASQGSGTK
jgi:peptidyl-prolyl cis-trans isomerase A (cyclophilin A)